MELPPAQVEGRSLESIVDAAIVKSLRDSVDAGTLLHNPLYLGQCHSLGRREAIFDAIAHENSGVLILELEPIEAFTDIGFQNLYALVRDFVSSLQHANTARDLAALASREVRRITGFDRTLVYQFDEEWNGTTIAESLDPEAYAPYLDLRFPASDIPKQARELYRLNRLRLIVDANHDPVPLQPPMNPLDNRPLDMSFASLRSVSPIHLEYLRNMNAMASMSISILRHGQLWGLIACHHRQPRQLSFEIRTACDFIGQVLSVQLEARQLAAESEERVRLRSLQTQLLAFIAEAATIQEGLSKDVDALLGFADASGAMIVIDDTITRLGRTPAEAWCRALIDWIAENGTSANDTWNTDALATLYPPAAATLADAAGALAIRISKLHQSYIVWFRPEALQTVKWGGDPHKTVSYENGVERLHPRKSFEIWRETVSGRSLRWQSARIEAAAEFRNAIVGIVLRKAEELAAVSAKLESTNQELAAFSYSVSHDLRAPFRHIVGYAELLKETLSSSAASEANRYVNTIIESARYAGKLVDNLLSFSQMGRAALNVIDVNLAELVNGLRSELQNESAGNKVPGREVQWEIEPLPQVRADRMMLRLVLRNLLENAVKYSRASPSPKVRVGTLPIETLENGSREHVFFVKDNGVGFDMKYAAKLFGVFQRLHRVEDYEGTGIGLANVRRIISRHGGRTWANGTLDQGATFYFSLPVDGFEPPTQPLSM